jgi:hypothetical protein
MVAKISYKPLILLIIMKKKLYISATGSSKSLTMDYRNTTGNSFDFVDINPGRESKPVVIDDYQQTPLSQTSDEQVGGYHQ